MIDDSSIGEVFYPGKNVHLWWLPYIAFKVKFLCYALRKFSSTLLDRIFFFLVQIPENSRKLLEGEHEEHSRIYALTFTEASPQLLFFLHGHTLKRISYA